MSETNPLRIKLSRVATSDEPNAALLRPGDSISVGDVREVMRLFANMDGWYRCACEKQEQLMSANAKLAAYERVVEAAKAWRQFHQHARSTHHDGPCWDFERLSFLPGMPAPGVVTERTLLDALDALDTEQAK